MKIVSGVMILMPMYIMKILFSMDFIHVLGKPLVALCCHVSFAGFCVGKFVQHQKDKAMQKKGVEEGKHPGKLVAHDYPPHAEGNFVVRPEFTISSLSFLSAECGEGVQAFLILR